MNYEQCTFLQATAADCLPISSWDTSQLSLLSGTPTPAKSLESEPQTDGFQACTCGKEMSDCLIHPSTPESWIASMRGSLALMFQQPENKQALDLRRAAACIEKSSESLTWYDHDTSTWKTSQQSLLMDLEQFSGTWPRSGILRNGRVYELPTLGHLTNVTAGGFWPTPTSHDAKKGAYPSEYNRNTPGIAVMLGGKPSPTFQEWQMGWPINHTALKESGMGKSHSKPQQPGKCSEGLK